jgi:hypothetical protein
MLRDPADDMANSPLLLLVPFRKLSIGPPGEDRRSSRRNLRGPRQLAYSNLGNRRPEGEVMGMAM